MTPFTPISTIIKYCLAYQQHFMRNASKIHSLETIKSPGTMENVTILRLPWDFFAVPIFSIQTIPNYNIPPAKISQRTKKCLRDHASNKGSLIMFGRIGKKTILVGRKWNQFDSLLPCMEVF